MDQSVLQLWNQTLLFKISIMNLRKTFPLTKWSQSKLPYVKVTKAWETTSKASRSRKGHNWHTRWICTKASLATVATCSLKRSHESRSTLKLCISSVWGSVTLCRVKNGITSRLGWPKTRKYSISPDYLDYSVCNAHCTYTGPHTCKPAYIQA